MAVPRKFFVAPTAATRELWRLAECGEVREVEDLLPQADFNARNEHGMTALMRAAYHGRVEIVRVLLEHGADPNAARNDNFTALSLAAFFGHSEIVEMLVGHGARTDVATRQGTSPQMWAKARSFGDVAQCLQKRRNEDAGARAQKRVTAEAVPPSEPLVVRRERSAPPPGREPEVVEKKFETEPLAVKTLSDPPEIWDLVPEAPRDFSAGSTFVARVGSITAGVVVCLAVVLIVAGGIVGLKYYWKSTPRSPQVVTTPPASSSTTTVPPTVAQPAPPAVTATTESTASEAPSISLPEPAVPRNSGRRSFPKPLPVKSETTTATVPSVASAPPPATAPKVETANTSSSKITAPASPQLISPPKTQQQPKAKVIQWP